MRRRRFLASVGVGLGGLTDTSRAMAPAVALDDPRIHVIENMWIPMADGVRLAARAFLPSDAHRTPAGIVIEYLPYRKRDAYRYRDDIAGPALAARGIGLLRVDIRGSGDSEGVIADEYLPPEQADALHLIDWVSRQNWCNGAVGMRGISYGSFDALQAAAKAPPALKAIVSACGTEQRYQDDIHYRGGCLLAAQLDWGMEWQVILRGPPDPRVVGADRWLALWQQRLDAVSPIAITWGMHQTDDATWRYGSVQDYDRLRCAILHSAGMLDCYVNSAARLMARAPQCPQKAVIGPWTHKWPGYPDAPGHHGAPSFVANGVPGPGIDWLPHEARWWRHWLASEANGIMEGPDLWAFRESAPPGKTFPADTPGAWIASENWPPRDGRQRVLHLGADGLADTPSASVERVCHPNQSVGFATPATYTSGDPASWWREQSGDDALSLCFDGAPLGEALDIMGQPVFTLRVRSDRPVAKLFVRLNEVLPDGTSNPVTNAVLNLTHRQSDSAPSALVPGRAYDVTLSGLFCCYRFAAGSRIRVAISESWWPATFPSPEPVTLTVVTGGSRVALPLAPDTAGSAPPFETLVARYAHSASHSSYRDRLAGVSVSGIAGRRLFVLETGSQEEERTLVPATGETLGDYSFTRRVIREDDPTSAIMETGYGSSYRMAGEVITLRAFVRLRATSSAFLYDESFEATRGGVSLCSQHWTRTVPRHLV